MDHDKIHQQAIESRLDQLKSYSVKKTFEAMELNH